MPYKAEAYSSAKNKELYSMSCLSSGTEPGRNRGLGQILTALQKIGDIVTD